MDGPSTVVHGTVVTPPTVVTVWLWVVRCDGGLPIGLASHPSEELARQNTPQPGPSARSFERALFEIRLPLDALTQVEQTPSQVAYFEQVQSLRKQRQAGR